MTTSTPTRPSTKDGLAKVADAEAVWVAAKDADHAASRERSELERRYRELEEQRRKLVYADPELVDLGVPVGPDNPTGKLDQEREALAFEAQVANNADALREQECTKDDALQRDYIEAMAKAVEIAKPSTR